MGCGASAAYFNEKELVMVDAEAPRVGYTPDVPLTAAVPKKYNGPGRVERDKDPDFSGPLLIGRIIGICVAIERDNYEYTVEVGGGATECIEEQYVQKLYLPELPWVSADNHEVAVHVHTHADKTFAAHLLSRDSNGLFEVRFVADGTILEQVPKEELREPDSSTQRNASPHSMAPDPRWLLDRKILANIDEIWPLPDRVAEAVQQVKRMRPATMPPLCGPFIGKGAKDSEGYPAHPAPLKELSISGSFVDTWAKYAGKIKFATTYRMGPGYPRFDSWVTSIDAGEALYFHAALPVYAGLICLGHFETQHENQRERQPEWIRASDVALVGIALYVDGELHACFENPEMDVDGESRMKLGHDSCQFIPGCASTYTVDHTWVGGVFCLAPSDEDMEVRDDIYNIRAYHGLLGEVAQKLAASPEARTGSVRFKQEFTLEVNLILSTNYLATLRHVCSGAVRVSLSDKGLESADTRLQDVLENRERSEGALNPLRPRKLLSKPSS
mmetsp:Transcript_65367/g.156286  ORF Transcript_65367/g.156286 Transcript_65367/m.156286 type:complete len:501 (+) Transcript_65367:81-1583(+)